MLALIIGIILLIATPTIYDSLSSTAKIKSTTDVVISIAMIYVLSGHVVPEVYGEIGVVSLFIFAVGFAGMSLLEYFCHGQFRRVHKIALVSVFLGFTVHIALDGVALSKISHNGHSHSSDTISALGLAVLLHRLPVAMLVWAKLYPILGRAKAFSILILMAIVSVGGFILGENLAGHQNIHHSVAFLEAFIAGCLMHVVVHQLHFLKRIIMDLFNRSPNN